MFSDLFVNSCILITFAFILSLVLKKLNNLEKHPVISKISYGIFGGILACILMLYCIYPTSYAVMLDLRFIPQVVVSVYGGFISAIISGGLIIAFRLYHFGISYSSTLDCYTYFLISIGCGVISSLRIGMIKKWIFCFIFSIVNISLYLAASIHENFMLLDTLKYFWSFSFVVVILIYYIIRHIINSDSALRKLKLESSKDFLTGLNNVRSYDELFNKLSKETIDKNGLLSMLFIDIDFFKKVNDTYGHSAGDFILKELAMLITQNVNIPNYICRIGGEEFCVILDDCSSTTAFSVAEDIRKSVQAHKFIIPGKDTINITISAGVANYPDTVSDILNLTKEADAALYFSKHNGRNRVSVNNSIH